MLAKISSTAQSSSINVNDTIYLYDRIHEVNAVMKMVELSLPVNHNFIKYELDFTCEDITTFLTPDLFIKAVKLTNKTEAATTRGNIESLQNQLKMTPLKTAKASKGKIILDNQRHKKIKLLDAVEYVNIKDHTSTANLYPIVEKALNRELSATKKYKVRSGWFTINKNTDLSESIIESPDSMKIKGKMVKLTRMISSTIAFEINSRVNLSRQDMLWFEHLFDPDLYKFSFAKNNNDPNFYLIDFSPVSNKADYVGQLKIDASDYGIHSLRYELKPNKRQERVNLKLLLGVKSAIPENSFEIEFVKVKNSSIGDMQAGHYVPSLLKSKSTRNLYLNRPISFIDKLEKTKTKLESKTNAVIITEFQVKFSNPVPVTDQLTQLPEKYPINEYRKI